ncbi:Threonine/homoserine/homoserine lactone efflux protein [Paenibacillus sp. UNCCL117]|uniref:LysE family transporter n=1 Tax=unclassified Paenibacillus TaxID=185978 RepID=UPI00087ED58E|nr:MULTISPECIES: LysE family transporter [unclassified Paenibacillus]SDC95675.1 Threonine/homoserine/homoserine lactone efflux protein [Paenibacillus sp. cl123]SFW30116.1 Threonine/homoserine/homoserine lactone efflux protein [Paenibacillus sp. UNCCL117]
MNTILSYFLLGLSLAAPIGPINAAQLDKGIKKGFMHAWMIGIGAILADAILMALIYFGVVHFLTTSFMRTFLWIFGCFVLIYSGVESLMGAGKLNDNQHRSSDTIAKSFFSGFFMSISSPLSILFWLGIYGSVLAETIAAYDRDHVLFYTGIMFTGLLVWDVTMAGLASTFRRFLTHRALTVISVLSGLSLIGFGLHFGIKAWQALFS